MINGTRAALRIPPEVSECALALTWKARPAQWEICSVSMNLAAFQLLPARMLIAGSRGGGVGDTGTCTMTASRGSGTGKRLSTFS